MKSWMIFLIGFLFILLTVSITANMFFIFKKGVLNDTKQEDIIGFINHEKLMEQNLKPHQIDEYRKNQNSLYNLTYDFIGELAFEKHLQEKGLPKDDFLLNYAKEKFPISKEKLILLENQKKEEGMNEQDAQLTALAILERESILKSYHSILEDLFKNKYFTISQKIKEKYLYQIPDSSRPQTSNKPLIHFFMDYQNQESKLIYKFLRSLQELNKDVYSLRIHFFPDSKLETSIELLSYTYCVWKFSGNNAFFEVSDYLFQIDDTSHKKTILLDYLKTKGFYENEIKTCAASPEVRQEILQDYELALHFGAPAPPMTVTYGRKFLGLILQKEFTEMVQAFYTQENQKNQ